MKRKVKQSDPFVESDKHVLDGLKLFPWTPSRVIAGQGMGLLYPEIGKEGWDQYQRTKIYPGALRDVIICLWLCTRTEDEVDQADSMPVDSYRQAKTWAASLGIHKISSNNFWQAYLKFSTIMTEVDSSITAPKVEPGEEPDGGND